MQQDFRYFRFKLTLFCLILFGLSSKLNGQSLELSVGYHINQLYTPSSFKEKYAYTGSFWALQYGAGIGIDSLRIRNHPFRISLYYDRFENQILLIYPEKNGSYRTDASLQKEMLNLSIYPLNFYRILNRMQFSLGLSTSILLSTNHAGTVYHYKDGEKSETQLKEEYPNLNRKLDLGALALLSYKIPISPSMALVPRVEFYYGIGNELLNLARPIRSKRIYINLALQKRL